ncbi:AAA family ATPase, partial [Neobacillus niacini]|uniref:AAA family ATPase n=1 Tax=Neobacillus niacini TaxID=86668 RepID=UPI0030008619
MGVNLVINKLIAFTEKKNKYFYTEFDKNVNIIHGKNTSGKSTVFQLLLYTFGINDNNDYLKE